MKNILLVGGVIILGGLLYVNFAKAPTESEEHNNGGHGPVSYVGETVTFYCPGEEEVMVQYDAGAGHIKLTSGANEYELERQVSASEVRYEAAGGTVIFQEVQGEAIVLLPSVGEEVVCTTTPLTSTPDITVSAPQSGSTVGSPIVLAGQARGYWYFEASAPVEVYDANSVLIGQGFVTASGDWMTENFVPFTGTVEYTLPVDVTGPVSGTLVFKRDNPSGLPENDDSFSVPVILE